MQLKRRLVLALVLSCGLSVAAAAETRRDFGPELPITRSLGLGGSMDAAVEGDTLYVIGEGKLRVADISDPREPRIVGQLTNLGNTRQIEVRDHLAYVTAREDGLFVVDVKKPGAPALLCHYDTIELATGTAFRATWPMSRAAPQASN